MKKIKTKNWTIKSLKQKKNRRKTPKKEKKVNQESSYFLGIQNILHKKIYYLNIPNS